MVGRCCERVFTLEKRANARIARKGRRPVPDDDEGLVQVETADPSPNRRWFTVSRSEAITARGGHKFEMTFEACGSRRPHRSLPLGDFSSRLLAVRETRRTGVRVDSVQEIGLSRFVRARNSLWLQLFSDHHKPLLRVDALDRVKRQQAAMPEENPVSADRESLPARLRIVDQLDDQADPSAAKVEYHVTGRLADYVGLAPTLESRFHAARGA